MMNELRHDRDFDPRHGEPVPVEPGIVRVTANNPGPFTFAGTNTFILGEERLVVIDPGPADEAHFEAVMAAIGGRPVSHILVTHTHRDHSPLTRRLADATWALVIAEGPHREARPLRAGEVNALEASADLDFVPDVAAPHGAIVETAAGAIECVATPGHTANHMAFAWTGDRRVLFGGDHVMAWSTSIVAPPDGAMGPYMASLELVRDRGEDVIHAAHGPAVTDVQGYVSALIDHRHKRETAIRERLAAGIERIGAIVEDLYRDVDPRLHPAAALSVLAHLEDLWERGLVVADPAPALDASFRPAA